MFKRERKVCLELNMRELQLAKAYLLEARNIVLQRGGPTEDIDALLLKLYKCH